MKRTAVVVACLVACLFVGGGGSTGCGGGTLGGNGGGPPITGGAGVSGLVSGGGGSGLIPGTAGADSPGVGGDGAPPPGGMGGRGGSGGSDGLVGGGGSGGLLGSGGVGGTLASCPATMSPVCGAAACGNGFVDTCLRIVGRDCHLASISEDCDGMDFGPRTCQTLGYASGALACSPSCTLDYGACSECAAPVGAAPAGSVAACATPLVQYRNAGSFGVAATDAEVGLALVEYDDTMATNWLTFARLSPALEVTSVSTLEDTSQPGRLLGTAIYQPAVAPIASGWVVGVCGSPEISVHAIDAVGINVGRTVVVHATDPGQACQPETLSLAARPGAGPLLLWETNDGVSASLISDDGLSAGASLALTGPDVAVSGASAAWVGDAFYVVVGIRPQTGGDAALRLITVRPDGTFSVVADVGVGSLTGTPRIAAGAGDLRVTYSGGAAGTGPYPVGVVWQRLALSGAPAGGSTAVAGYPAYLGEAPAIALGDDTVVLVPGSGHDELGVVVVDLDGKLVTPLLNVAKAPAIQVNVYDMVRRGSDLVVGWLSPLTGAVSLARVTP